MNYQAGFKIETKVVGVTFDNRQEIVAQLRVGEIVRLIREPSNPYDGNAIRVEKMNSDQFGYIDKLLAADLSLQLDRHETPVEATVKEIIGGLDTYSNYGVIIEFVVPESTSPLAHACPSGEVSTDPEESTPQPDIHNATPSITYNKHQVLTLHIFDDEKYGKTLSREITIFGADRVSNQFLDLIGTIFCYIRHHEIKGILFTEVDEVNPEDKFSLGDAEHESPFVTFNLNNIYACAIHTIKYGGSNIFLQGAIWYFMITTLLDLIVHSRELNDEHWWHNCSPESLRDKSEWIDNKLYELADRFRLTIEPPDIDEEPFFGPQIQAFFDDEIKGSNAPWANNQLHMLNEKLMYHDGLNEIAIPSMGGYLINSIRPAEVLVSPVTLVIKDENGDEHEPFEMPYRYEIPPGRRHKVAEDDLTVNDYKEQKSANEKEFEEKYTGLIPTGDYPYPYPFEYFNPVQSEVYHHKDTSNNMIISANTSAGKTIAAELLLDSTLEKGQRVIYLSPLKTLTEEKYTEWQDRYPVENISIMTGDYLLSPDKMKEVQASRIIVMTSEMMDSRTRKFESEKNHWMKEVGLVVVDESHILTTSRGDAVETGIMRFTLHCPAARILFLSATMPNVRELCSWLTSLNGKATDLIQSDWRPVKLEKYVIEYTDETNFNGRMEYWPTELKKIQLAVDLVMSKPDEKFLVFVHSKNTGRYLLKRLKEYNVMVNYHNADLGRKKRKQIENSFKDRNNGIRALVSTSTNAWGVNLPARNVVIVGVHRGFENVDELDIIQMAGRAGRYNIDTEGHAYLIVPAGEADYWTGIFSNPRPLTSVLNDRQKLAFHVLAEIYRKVVITETDLFSWYERSLAFRQGRMPFSKIEAEAVLQDLKQRNMIHDKNGRLQITGLGLTSAVMYYSPYDIDAWYKNFSTAFANHLETNEAVLAWAIGTIPKYSSYVPKEYKDLIGRWRATFQESGFYFDDKAVLALEAVYNCLTGQKAKGTLRSKMVEIKNDVHRTICALRMIDQRYARWRQASFWKDLESKFASQNKNYPEVDNSPGSPLASKSIGSQQSEHAGPKPSEDYDDAEDWGDADWAEYLGCDKDEVDYYFDSQM